MMARRAIGSSRNSARAAWECLLNAESVAALEYPNLTTTCDIELGDGQMFIGVSYVEGKTLRSVSQRPLAPDEALNITLLAGKHAQH